MATRFNFSARGRWKTFAAQILVGTLTCQIALLDTAILAPRALAASDIAIATGQATNLLLPATPENPAQTINRITDSSVIVTAQVPADASKFTVVLLDQFGKDASHTTRVKEAGLVTTKVNAVALADGPITLKATYETPDGAQSPWLVGPEILKDTQKPEQPIITAPENELSTSNATTVITGEAADKTTIKAIKSHDVIAQTESTGTFSLTVPLTPGSNRFHLVATDTAGNQSSSINVPTIISTAQNQSSQVLPEPTHLHATALSASRVHLSWMIENAQLSQVDHFVVFSDNGTGTVDYSTPIGITEGNATEFVTATLPQGTHLFTVRSHDRNGAMTTNTNTVSQSVLGEQTKTSFKGGQQLIDFRPEQPVTAQTGSNATHHGKLSIESFGRINPSKHALPGTTPVGNFYDLTTNNQTVFPLNIRIYYTADELTAAHVINERQLKGLSYFDESSTAWKSFEQIAINTTDVINNGIAYAGYIEATTTHLTTIVIAADTVAPTQPANLTAEAGDMRTKLTWNSVADAMGYWVRYRKATNIDTVPYTTVFVSGQQQTTFTINGLANGTLYEFGVASEDTAGNQSGFAVVEQTPTASGPTTDFVTPSTAQLAKATSSRVITTTGTTSQSSTTPSSNNQSQVQSTPTQEKQDETPEDGTVKGGTDKKDQTQSARSLVTLLIVLVAAAAGFGGYYGYQWWTARPEEFDEPTEERAEEQPVKKPEKSEKADKSDRTGGRW
jgi:hypothetical protein